MKPSLFGKIQSQWDNIVHSLDVKRVCDALMTKFTLLPNELQRINSQVTDEDQARQLLKILKVKDDQHFENFLAVLDITDHKYIADAIRKAKVPSEYIEPDPICIDLTKNEDLDSFVDLTCNQGVDDASVIVISSYESDDASSSWDRSSNPETNSVSQMKRPVNTISSLSKGSTDWRLCVRVTSKSNIFRMRKMDGRYYRIIEYFSVFFRDESGQIRGVFFKDSVKNFKQFYKLLKVKKVFYVSGASVTETNPLYVRAHLELKMNNKTSIEPCRVVVDIPIIGEYHFTKINMLCYTQEDKFVDVIGVVDSIGEIETISTEYKKEQAKRELNLVDQSGMVVSVTFWGQHARAFSVRPNAIIALLGVKVSDWKGLSLSMQASTQMHIEPDIQETRSLRKWYDDIGNGKIFTMVFR